MKIVKLDRRFRQFKEHGYKMALRFDQHCDKVMALEKTAREKLNDGGWNPGGTWYGYFGKRSGRLYSEPRPYWIAFRNEADVTLVLLGTDLT